MTNPSISTLQLDLLRADQADQALTERTVTEFLHSPDGLKLFTQRWLPDGTVRAVVVLVHGVAEHSGRYAALAGSLASRGIAVEAMDHRGHGRSEGRRVWVDRFDQYLDDFGQFINLVQKRHPAKPLFIFGHSLGGTITTLYALERKPQIRGIVLSAPALRPGSNIPEWTHPLGRFLGRYLPRLPVQKFSSAEMSHNVEAVRRYEEDPLDYNGWLPARTAGEILNAIARIHTLTEQFEYALLLLHGTGDRVTHPEGSRSFHQRAGSADKTLRLYKGLYHKLLEETEKELVVSDILSWLESRC
jgi:acylglycerol lipase